MLRLLETGLRQGAQKANGQPQARPRLRRRVQESVGLLSERLCWCRYLRLLLLLMCSLNVWLRSERLCWCWHDACIHVMCVCVCACLCVCGVHINKLIYMYSSVRTHQRTHQAAAPTINVFSTPLLINVFAIKNTRELLPSLYIRCLRFRATRDYTSSLRSSY